MNKFISLSLSILILNGCYEMSINNPPKPKKIPTKLEAHGDIRIDDYYWMRDDTRSDPELISYLESENDYFQNWRDSNIDYESAIYKELKSMIPDEEETLRVKDGSFYYYSRIKASEQYSTYYRNNHRHPQQNKGDFQIFSTPTLEVLKDQIYPLTKLH